MATRIPTDEEMIARRVSKGFNAEESKRLLAEIQETAGSGVIGPMLRYQEFVTDAQADAVEEAARRGRSQA